MQDCSSDLDCLRTGAPAGWLLMIGMLALGCAGTPALAVDEQFETLVLNRGRTVVGSIIDANRNTVAIKNAVGLAEIVRADDIQTVFIPARNPEDQPFFGSFVDWQDGIYKLNINFELIKVKDGAMLGEPEPIAPSKPAAFARRAPDHVPLARPAAEPSEPTSAEPASTTPAPVPVALAAPAPTAADAAPAAAAPESVAAVDTGMVSLLIEGGQIDEGAAALTYQLTLSAPLDQPFYLAYSTLDGSARGGEDYEAAREVLIIPTGKQRAEFGIALIDDGETEGDETLTLSVGASNRAVEIDRSRLESVIVDND